MRPATEDASLSFAAGPTDQPLLDETIGANFERTVSAHGDGEALVEVASGRRWTYAELDSTVDEVARGLLGAGIEASRKAEATGAAGGALPDMASNADGNMSGSAGTDRS